MARSARDVIIDLTELGNIITQMSHEFLSKHLVFHLLLLLDLFDWDC